MSLHELDMYMLMHLIFYPSYLINKCKVTCNFSFSERSEDDTYKNVIEISSRKITFFQVFKFLHTFASSRASNGIIWLVGLEAVIQIKASKKAAKHHSSLCFEKWFGTSYDQLDTNMVLIIKAV